MANEHLPEFGSTITIEKSSFNLLLARLKAEGYGEQYPVAGNETEEGRAQNRRIDIRVTGK